MRHMNPSVPVRLTEPLREGLVELCADNLSAGIRACIILARYHEGYDIETLKPDAERLIGEPLARPIKDALLDIILDRRRESKPAPVKSAPTAAADTGVAAPTDDPFSLCSWGIGMPFQPLRDGPVEFLADCGPFLDPHPWFHFPLLSLLRFIGNPPWVWVIIDDHAPNSN